MVEKKKKKAPLGVGQCVLTGIQAPVPENSI